MLGVLHACFVFFGSGGSTHRDAGHVHYFIIHGSCMNISYRSANSHTHTYTPIHTQAARRSKYETTLRSCRRRLRRSCLRGKAAARNGDPAVGAGESGSLHHPFYIVCGVVCNVACCCGAVVLSAPQLEAPQCKQDWRTNIVRFA